MNFSAKQEDYSSIKVPAGTASKMLNSWSSAKDGADNFFNRRFDSTGRPVPYISSPPSTPPSTSSIDDHLSSCSSPEIQETTSPTYLLNNTLSNHFNHEPHSSTIDKKDSESVGSNERLEK